MQIRQDAQNNLTVGHAFNQVNTTGNLVSAGSDLTLSGAQLTNGGDGALVSGLELTVASVMDPVRTDEHDDAAAKQYDKRLVDHLGKFIPKALGAAEAQLARGGTVSTGARAEQASTVRANISSESAIDPALASHLDLYKRGRLTTV